MMLENLQNGISSHIFRLSFIIQIRQFLTDLAQLWYRGLILGVNAKSEAILWIRGWYHVEIGDYL